MFSLKTGNGLSWCPQPVGLGSELDKSRTSRTDKYSTCPPDSIKKSRTESDICPTLSDHSILSDIFCPTFFSSTDFRLIPWFCISWDSKINGFSRFLVILFCPTPCPNDILLKAGQIYGHTKIWKKILWHRFCTKILKNLPKHSCTKMWILPPKVKIDLLFHGSRT